MCWGSIGRLAWSVGTQGQKGYRWHKEALGLLGVYRCQGATRECQGASGGVGCEGCIGAGKKCRYSGVRRGIGGIRRHWGSWGCTGVRGPLGSVRGHQGVWGVRGVLGLARSVGTQGSEGYRWHKGALGAPRGCQGAFGAVRGHQGCRGCQGCIEDGRWTWSPITLGPTPGCHHNHWFPLGSDLAKAKQVTEMSSADYYIHLELYLVTVCTFVSMLPSPHILTHNVKKCYMDYILCRPIYAYTYTINLMYYNTMVLIMENYFPHQTSELGTSYCKCQADLM